MFNFLSGKKDKGTEITVSSTTVLRVVVLVILGLFFAHLVKQAGHALSLIFIAFFLALALNEPGLGNHSLFLGGDCSTSGLYCQHCATNCSSN
jgi:hypothetical protein